MTPPSTLPLLLEIGCEEIPARFLAQAQKDLGDRLQAALEEARLLSVGAVRAVDSDGVHRTPAIGVHEPPLQTYSTPRRLVAHAREVLGQQPEKVEEIIGPPVKVAVDAKGKYTRAAESFAQKNAGSVHDLTRIATPKGEYLAVKKTTLGRPALDVLSEILPEVITGLTFPKGMYWTGKSGPRFARPIRWILALLGEGGKAQVVPFEVAAVKAGDFTFGHRTDGKAPVRVSSFEEYVMNLHEMHVELDPEKRLERVRAECKALLEVSGLRVVEDKSLEDWVVNSTEWPRALRGKFEERFLKLPREILVTVMRDHQKYFAVEDQNGTLRPGFVTVLNLEGDPRGLIRAGHERVLTARFSDAEFFWNADQKIPLRDRLPKLEKVTYQEKLGSYADKVRRMEAIAEELCATLEKQGRMTAQGATHTLRAVRLSKCDLTTQMVQEFTELQGVVGGLYARVQGEAQEVAEAIYDQYLPQGVEDRCPRALVGAVVSLADKMDSVVAGFAVGHAPTGSSDPFGLRRQGNGIIKLLIAYELRLSPMGSLFVWSVDALLKGGLRASAGGVPNLEGQCGQFFRERLGYYLESVRGLRYDTVRAALAAGSEVPLDALRRAEALEKIRGGEDMEALCAAAKRIKNILSKSATDRDWQPGGVEVVALREDAERDLHMAYAEVSAQMDSLLEAGNYERALELIARLRPSVDRFFDKVLVMAEDKGLRQNRLRLLGKLDALFSSIADLSKIESSTLTSVGASTVKGRE